MINRNFFLIFLPIAVVILHLIMPMNLPAMDPDHDIYMAMKQTDLSVLDAKSLFKSMKLRKDKPDYAKTIERWSYEKAPIHPGQFRFPNEHMYLNQLMQDQATLQKFLPQEPIFQQKNVGNICDRIELKKSVHNLYSVDRRDMNMRDWISSIFIINDHKNLLDKEDTDIIKRVFTKKLFSDLLIHDNSILYESIDKETIQKFNCIMNTVIHPMITETPVKYSGITQESYEALIKKWSSTNNIETFVPFMFDYEEGLLLLQKEKTILQDYITNSAQDTQKENFKRCLNRINAKIAIGQLLSTIEPNENPEHKKSLGDIVRNISKFNILPNLLEDLKILSDWQYFSLNQIGIMNHLVTISNHLEILDEFDKAEITHSSALGCFLTQYTKQCKSPNQFFTACNNINNEIKRIKKEIEDKRDERHTYLFNMEFKAFPYPDNRFVELIAYKQTLQSSIKEKFRDKDEVSNLERSLLKCEKLLNTLIEKLINNIGGRFCTLSHEEWIRKLEAYFPKNNPDLMQLLTKTEYQAQIDTKLKELKEQEDKLRAEKEKVKAATNAQPETIPQVSSTQAASLLNKLQTAQPSAPQREIAAPQAIPSQSELSKEPTPTPTLQQQQPPLPFITKSSQDNLNPAAPIMSSQSLPQHNKGKPRNTLKIQKKQPITSQSTGLIQGIIDIGKNIYAIFVWAVMVLKNPTIF